MLAVGGGLVWILFQAVSGADWSSWKRTTQHPRRGRPGAVTGFVAASLFFALGRPAAARAWADGCSGRRPAQADGEASDYFTTTYIRICVGWIVQMTVKVPRLENLCE